MTTARSANRPPIPPARLAEPIALPAVTPRLAVATALLAGAAFSALANVAAAEGRFLYIQSNDHRDGQNAIIAYERGEDGSLSLHPASPFLTDGTGIDNDTNGKLGPNDNDTPIIASPDGGRLFAVNGHTNTIAVFDVMPDGALTPVSGSPFQSHGVGPVSLSMSGDVLVVANRNEDPHQLDALRGGANSSYASFRIGADGGLTFLSKIANEGGHKATQVLFASAQLGLAFGNDFQVDADFDGEGTVSGLFGGSSRPRGTAVFPDRRRRQPGTGRAHDAAGDGRAGTGCSHPPAWNLGPSDEAARLCRARHPQPARRLSIRRCRCAVVRRGGSEQRAGYLLAARQPGGHPDLCGEQPSARRRRRHDAHHHSVRHFRRSGRNASGDRPHRDSDAAWHLRQ